MRYICAKCGRTEAVTTRKPHCECGGLWKLDDTPPVFSLDAVDPHEWSQFRYRRFMALDDESWRGVSMGEGMTPVVRLDGDVLLKMDYFMPTLSFKDRGAAVLIAHCKSIGVEKVVQDSSGNAGNSVAAYCARAGIGCEIFVPEGTSPKKIDMIRAHGAVCTVVPGTRDHCADVCRAKVEQEGVYYANHVYNPFFYEGTKTYIYEVFEQLGHLPENIVIPVGNGTLFLGAMYALEHLLRMTARRPILSRPRRPLRRASPSASRCAVKRSSRWRKSTASALSMRRRIRSSQPAQRSRARASTVSTRPRQTTRHISNTAASTGRRPIRSSPCAAQV